MVLTAATTIHLSESYSMNVAMAAVFYVIGFPCICLWAGFGTAMRRVLTDARRLRALTSRWRCCWCFSLYPIALPLDAATVGRGETRRCASKPPRVLLAR